MPKPARSSFPPFRKVLKTFFAVLRSSFSASRENWLSVTSFFKMSWFVLSHFLGRVMQRLNFRDGLQVKPAVRCKSDDTTYMVVFALTLLGELLVGLVFAFLIVILILALLVLSQELVNLGLNSAGEP